MTTPFRPDSATRIRSLFSVLAVVALLLGLFGSIPSARAAQGDAPTFEEIASQTVTIDDDRSDAAWRATTMPTVDDETSMLPFGPGFLYATDGTLLVYQEGEDGFDRVRGATAIAVDGTRQVAPVSFDGAPVDFLAIELADADADTEATGNPFDLPAGDWNLTLWSLDLSPDATDPVPLGDATTDDGEPVELDPDVPALIVAVDGSAEVMTDADADAPVVLTAGEDSAAMMAAGPVSIRLADGADGATVLALTASSDGGDSDSTTSRASARSGGGGGGGGGDGTGSGSESSRSARPSVKPSPSRSAKPSPSAASGTEDSDGDGLPDEAEAQVGTDPDVADTDGDGLSDLQDLSAGLNPLSSDTDNDCVTDGRELQIGTSPLIPISNGLQTDGQRFGCDVGGGGETGGGTTDPPTDETDSDGDGLPDEAEAQVGTDPDVADTDGDGLSDLQDLSAGLNPLSPDTDNDCVTDGRELQIGTSPLIPISNGLQTDGQIYGCG